MNTRRQFVLTLVPAAALAATGWRSAHAQANKLSESDPAASALGYKEDATKVDRAKFPKYAPGQLCSNCSLYQAKGSNDAWAPCGAFGGKQVAAKGWCAAWVKKA
jgi:hypothetical protein